MINGHRPAVSGVLVANPGGVTWMLDTALGLAERGRLASYCSPAVVGADQLATLEERLPAPLARAVVGELRRRAAPPGIDGAQIARVGTAMELAYVGFVRAGLSLDRFAFVQRARGLSYDRGVARRLSPGLDAVIGYSEFCTKTFRAARSLGVSTVLDYPVAHYATVERLMLEEAELVPGYAGTLQGHNYRDWQKRRFQNEIDTADRLIMLSSYHQRTFEENGVEAERCFIAPLCVDLELFMPAPAFPEGTFRVAFCGQITQRKGLSYLVEGFKRAELADAELVIVGRPVGTTEPWIHEPRVRFVPPMPRFALPEVLRECHVITLPSILEGFGATALEGMACGLPAVVSENTLGHDVIEDGVDGWVIPIRDPDAIAERLRRLYDDRDLLRTMGAAARAKAEQYPWERYRRAIADGIAPLVAQGPAA